MEKQRWEESEKKREEEKRSEKRKSQRIEDAGAWKGSKVATHCILQWFVAPEGRKGGSPKRRAQSHLARWDEKLHAVVAQSTFRSQNVESTPFSEHFRSWDDEKAHAIVAGSTFPRQKCKKLTVSDRFWKFHFWKLRWWKSARCCGAKHIFKSKYVKMYKTHHARSTFGSWDDEKVHATVAQSAFPKC